MNDEFLNEQINNIQGEGELTLNGINIKIRTLDNEFQLNINSENKVEELKKRIENISRVPTDRQRLIFRGKLLKDGECLKVYKIEDSDVVHLVAKTGEQIENANSEESAMNNDSTNTRTGRREASFFSIMNRLVRLDNEGENTNSNINGNTNSNSIIRPTIIPAVMRSRVRRGPNSQDNSRESSDFNSIECRETIFQNFVSINNLMECQESSTDSTNNLAGREKELFDFKKKKLIKGQWVDVKDTIEQWLEAQVIDIRGDQVYIHYNGWGTRWDEWINMDSERIRPFRFHTRQNSHSNYQSPFPSVKPDANVSLEGNLTPQESFFEVFDDLDKYYSYVSGMMNQIRVLRRENTPANQKEVFRLSKHLAPFFDKFGRSMADVGGYLYQTMRNNKLEDLDKKLFEASALDPELKAYDQSEMLRVELEEAAKRSRRESGANIMNPVNPFDRSLSSQVPILDSSLQIQANRHLNSSPLVDIYVQTFYSPMGSALRFGNGRGENNTGNNPGSANAGTTNSNIVGGTGDSNIRSVISEAEENSNNTNNNPRNQLTLPNPFIQILGNSFSQQSIMNNSASGRPIRSNSNTQSQAQNNLAELTQVANERQTRRINNAENFQIESNHIIHSTNNINNTVTNDSNVLLGSKRNRENEKDEMITNGKKDIIEGEGEGEEDIVIEEEPKQK